MGFGMQWGSHVNRSFNQLSFFDLRHRLVALFKFRPS